MTVDRFEIPVEIAEATQAHFRRQGSEHAEGVVLWRGTLEPPRVTAVIIPEQATSAGRFRVPLVERQRITRELAGTGEFIVAQVHSHPGRAFHSAIDDEEAIPRRLGSYSLVVPDFGSRQRLLDDGALFRLSSRGWEPAPLETFQIPARGGPLRWLIDRVKSFGRSAT
jgi:hypothetical protein